MRLVFIILLLGFSPLSSSAENKELVTQTIQYENRNATEVVTVWGVNGWQAPAKDLWPEGTYKDGNLLYTKMQPGGNSFETVFKVVSGTKLDFVFQITKGPRDVPSNTWDTNGQRDYGTICFNSNILSIQSDMEVKGKESLSMVHYTGTLSVVVFLICVGIAFKYRKRLREIRPLSQPLWFLMVGSGVLFLFLLLFRMSVAWVSWELYYRPFTALKKFMWVGFYDHLYILIVVCSLMLLMFLFRKSAKIQRALSFTFIAIAVVSIAASIFNVKVVDVLGKPFNYRWLYYSGFLQSTDAKSALSANADVYYFLKVTALCLLFVIFTLLATHFITSFVSRFNLKQAALASFLCLNFGYLAYAGTQLDRKDISVDRLVNPIVEFAGSVNPFSSAPELYSMNIPDSLYFKESSRQNLFHLATPPKNVLIVVLESTAAEYVQPYDSIYKVTPELASLQGQAIVFDNIYAHAPATNKSMVCLMGSLYPWLSYYSITQEHPNLNVPTISTELKRRGYRTAFFNSADNAFQRTGDFLSFRKFDNVNDCHSISCPSAINEGASNIESMNGIGDDCTGDELCKWLSADTSKPFFGMMWTYQTHYPYYGFGSDEKIVSDPFQNRYLNAVKNSDRIIGNIVNTLKKNGQFANTLLVVIGDHGEAFGRHNQTAHASRIYEENVHIPCFLINPSFNAKRMQQIGGMVDIAPTIFDVLNLPLPREWQGASLFDNNRLNRTYFFSPWSDYLFGFRENNMKYVFNASKDVMEIYDLANDPLEQKNLFDERNKGTLAYYKIAAWVQYQNEYMQSLLNVSKLAAR